MREQYDIRRAVHTQSTAPFWIKRACIFSLIASAAFFVLAKQDAIRKVFSGASITAAPQKKSFIGRETEALVSDERGGRATTRTIAHVEAATAKTEEPSRVGRGGRAVEKPKPIAAPESGGRTGGGRGNPEGRGLAPDVERPAVLSVLLKRASKAEREAIAAKMLGRKVTWDGNVTSGYKFQAGKRFITINAGGLSTICWLEDAPKRRPAKGRALWVTGTISAVRTATLPIEVELSGCDEPVCLDD